MSTLMPATGDLTMFKCDLCGKLFPRILIHEHHLVKREKGGQDTMENLVRLDAGCHTAVHQIEGAMKSDTRRPLIPSLLDAIFPGQLEAQKTCLRMATTAALGRPPEQPPLPDYRQWDTDNEVYLTPPPKVHPLIKQQAKILGKELKNPKTGRSLGVGGYLKLLVEQDLLRRGFIPPKKTP